jgi:parallel beta-helix repeat protein
MNKKVAFGIILLFCFIISTWDPSVDLLVNNKANTFELSSSNDVLDNDLYEGLQVPFKLKNVPIIIDGNDDFKRKAKRYGWDGDGSPTNPYLIEYYDLSMPPTKKGKKFQLPSAITIKNTDVYFNIQHNTLTSADGNYIGITLSNVVHGSIIDNDLTNFAIGIYLDGCMYVNIEDNDIIGYSGLTSSALLDIDIKFKIEGTAAISYGIFLNPSDFNTIFNNRISDFTGSGMYLEGSTYNDLIDNNISGGNGSRGIYLNGSDWNDLIGNDILSSTSFSSSSTGVKYSVGGVAGTAAISYGIFLNPSHHNYISGNTISDFMDSGMYLSESTYNDLIGNDINNNIGNNYSLGIYLDGSNWNDLIGNDISGPASLPGFSSNVKYSVGGVAGTAAISYGIFLNPSHSNTIFNNQVYNNTGHGLYLQGSSENTVEGNTIIDNNENGIFLEDSDTTSIINNVIYDDDLYGINLDYGSSDNFVTENDIIGNNIGGTSQLLDDGTGNQFTNNFLVDHDNTDADNDGYSDSSYSVDGYADNYDSYPNALPVQDLTGIEFADLDAEIDYESETLNLKNLGNYETVKIKLPVGYSVTNIDVSTVKTDGGISAEEEAQVQNAKTLIVKFNRSKLIEYLLTIDFPYFPYPVKLNVTGYLNGHFMMFYGFDYVTLIHGEPSDPALAIVQNEEPILHPTQAFINQVVDITMVGFTQIFSGRTGSLLLLSMISVVTIRKFYRKRRI